MSGTREISDRLREALYERVAFAANLKPALALASEQLELLCPVVMGMTDKGFLATLATTLPRGTWLMVLANPRKVLTIQMLAPPTGVDRLEILEHCVACAIEKLGHAPNERDLLETVRIVVERYGGKPGKKSPQVGQGTMMQILGLLFGAAAPAHRADLIKGVEGVISAAICPLHVGLVGRGSTTGTTSGVWPLGLPFAPYVDSLGL